MKSIRLYVMALFASAISLGSALAAERPCAIVPQPQHVSWQAGSFSLSQASISYGKTRNGREAALWLQDMTRRVTGRTLPIVKGDKGTIRLAIQPDGNSAAAGDNPRGSYTLHVTDQLVSVTGTDYPSLVNGLASLVQLMQGGKIDCVEITDAPRFAWRGFHLDCSRHFYTKEEVEEIIRLASLYKMNRFHWHLTDDQGWRIEIKRYPELTAKSAWRHFNYQDSTCMRQARLQDNPDLLIPASKLKIVGTDTLYGGFYTQKDIKEVVAFAKRCGVEVVPEIDMPGHELAAIEAVPGISCFPEIGWGKVFSSPLCPGKETTLEFCRNVWKEVFPLFPYGYVHIGGDEVAKDNWRKCPDCQKRIADNSLKNEEELQSWFIHEMEKYINAHGKKMIGWDEIIEGGLSQTSTVMWWRTWAPMAVAEATAHGNDVIMTPGTPLYFSDTSNLGKLSDIYNYEPVDSSLSAAQQQHILGIQANLWGEHIPTLARALYLLYPNMLAAAELAWTQPGEKDYQAFYGKLNSQLTLLHQLGVPYHIPSLTGFYNVNAFTDKGTLTVNCEDPSAIVRYTTDGTFPTTQSPRYDGPITVTETTHFILRTFNADGRADEMAKADFVKQALMPAVMPCDSTACKNGHKAGGKCAKACAPSLKPGLQTVWHDFAGVDCAKIDAAPVNATYTTPTVEIPDGVKGDIGLIITGYIDIPADGIYTFGLKSDDGSWLKIDGRMVVNGNYEQSPTERTAQQALAKGLHRIEVRYFDHNGGMLRMNVLDPEGKLMQPDTLYRY